MKAVSLTKTVVDAPLTKPRYMKSKGLKMGDLKPVEAWLQAFLHEEDGVLITDVLQAARDSGTADHDVVAVLLSQGFRARDGKWLIWPEHW